MLLPDWGEESSGKVKWSKSHIAVLNQNYHTATGNHMPYGITVLPATRQRWLSRLYPSRSWYARLSRPGWWLYPKVVYQRNTFIYLRNNRAVSWLGVERPPSAYAHTHIFIKIIYQTCMNKNINETVVDQDSTVSLRTSIGWVSLSAGQSGR